MFGTPLRSILCVCVFVFFFFFVCVCVSFVNTEVWGKLPWRCDATTQEKLEAACTRAAGLLV